MCNCGCNNEIGNTLCPPADQCSCKIMISSDCVTPFTEDLPCMGVAKGKTLTETMLEFDSLLCQRFTSVEKFLKIVNIGTGIGVYKGISNIGEKLLKTLLGSNLITLTEGVNEITIAVNEPVLSAFIKTNQKTYSALNIGTGASVYKDTTIVGDNNQFNLRKINTSNSGTGAVILKTQVENANDISITGRTLKSSDSSVTISQGVDDIDITTNGAATKVTAGIGISVTGLGTTPSPYVINSTLDGSETKINAGTNITQTGNGTIASPYVISAAVYDGSETKITNGMNTTVSGSGTIGSPYQIAVPGLDGSETKLIAGLGTTVSGNGTITTPYQVDIPKNNVVNAGFFAGLNVGTSSALTVGGDVTAAIHTLAVAPDSIITVTLANPMPSVNYIVDIKLQGQSSNLNDDNDIASPVFKPISTTQFQVGFREIASLTQSLKVHLQVIAY